MPIVRIIMGVALAFCVEGCLRSVAQPALQTLTAKYIASDSEIRLRPYAEMVLGNPNDRTLDNVPRICRQTLVTTESDFESQYRFVTFERALVGFLLKRSRENSSEMLPGVVRADETKTTVVGPVSLRAEDLSNTISTRSNTYEAIVSAIERHEAAQIINLELLGRPVTEAGKGIILVQYVSHFISKSGEVGHLGGARVTFCLMPEDKGKVVVYLENVVES